MDHSHGHRHFFRRRRIRKVVVVVVVVILLQVSISLPSMSITTMDDSSSNGTAAAAASSIATPAVVKSETGLGQPPTTTSNATNENHHGNDDNIKQEEDIVDEEEEVEEEVDEEDNFFTAIEEEQHQQEVTLHVHDHQPHDAEAAPKLLQQAIKAGQVGVDDSEVESDEEYKKKKKVGVVKSEGGGDDGGVTTAIAAVGGMKTEEGGDEKKEEEDNHHVHHRNNQLDFLLSRAKEYSDFISADIDELQNNLTAQAAAAAAAESEGGKKKGSKKRGGDKEESSSKKGRKRNKKNNGEPTDGEVNLQSAQDQYHARHGSRPIFIQPKNLAKDVKLKDYQLEGVRWLVSLYENGVSGILADEMGLGKTIQVISLIAHLRIMKVAGPFIIVAPLATLPNWVREFEKWLPSQPVVRFHGTQKDRDALIEGPLNARLRKNDDFPIIITSYEVAVRDEKRLNKIGEYTYLVVDEGQRLKNHRCTLITSLKRIRSSNRLLLSGTPIQNNLDELWSLLNFVNPSIFDDLSIFQSWFGFRNIGQKTQGSTTEEDVLVAERKNQTVSKLHEILRPFLLRRIKKDVLADMPPKKEIIVYAGLSKLQEGYGKMIDQGILRDVLLNQGIEQARQLSQINKQMNHRKNCNHPFIFGEPIDPASGAHMGSAHPQLLIRASGKFALLDRMLERLYRDKHQVLIFSQMTRLLNVIEDYLVYRQWNYCRIDGTTKIDDRQRQMDVFNAEKTNGLGGNRNSGDDRHFVFLLSTRAGGVGINLATADTCILFDSDWNPHQDSQAMDRCHRIGQDRPVAVYRLLTVGSVDIDMMEKQMSKKKLERMAIVGGDFRKAGSRSRGEFKTEALHELLNDDVKDLQSKGTDVESIRIDDEEFENIMNREKLFAEGEGAIPTEGKMYDVVEAQKGDTLGAMA